MTNQPKPMTAEEIIVKVHNHGKNRDVIAGHYRPYLSPELALDELKRTIESVVTEVHPDHDPNSAIELHENNILKALGLEEADEGT